MSVSLPKTYVSTPAWVIESAFKCSPPKKALLGQYTRLLALAWNRKDGTTPVMRETFFYDHDDGQGNQILGYLRVARRQFFEVVSEMESMGWLRSSRPRTGFVQFAFVSDPPVGFADIPPNASHLGGEVVGAENCTDGAKNRTSAVNRTDLKRIEEDESINSLNTNIPPHPSSEGVRKIAQVQKTAPEFKARVIVDEAKMRLLVEHLPLLFDPKDYGGALEWSDKFVAGIPERALAWIAKAYHERENFRQAGGALGLIVNHLGEQDEPARYYVQNWFELLTDAYLEAVGEMEYTCKFCPDRFETSASFDEHMRQAHPYVCEECRPPRTFETEQEATAHYFEAHDPLRVVKAREAFAPNLTDSDPAVRAWETVKEKLQMEMPRASFDTWVRDTQAVRCDGNALTVAARNSYARDWLENRMTARVKALLEDKQVVFVVMAEVEA
jgi:hypothetical protein